MRQCKSEHRDFKKAKEIAWDSGSLRTETLRVMLMQFLNVTAVVCQ
jgi:ABC-type transport system involved in cytochrome bd biosynthesis fused ATPase/permease subunit